MSPKGSRKRVKPSPSGADSPSPASLNNAALDRSDSQTQERSWYPGPWSAISRASKAAPVTEVARESISVAQNMVSSVAHSSTPRLDSPKRSRAPSIQLISKSGASSTRSLPADVATTRVNIASNGSASAVALGTFEDTAATEAPTANKESSDSTAKQPDSLPEKQGSNSDDNLKPDSPHTAPAGTGTAEQTGGWLSWLYRTGNPEQGSENPSESTPQTAKPLDSSETPNNPGPQTKQIETEASTEQRGPQEQAETQETTEDPNTTEVSSTAQKRSWLQMWYGAPSNKPEQTAEPAPPPAEPEQPTTKDVDMSPKDPPNEPGESPAPPQPPSGPSKSSGWSFWSKEQPKEGPPNKPQEGEVVEASIPQDTPSRPAELEPDTDANVKITPKGSINVKPPKDSRVKDGTVSTVEATSTSTPLAEPRPPEVTASKQLQRILPNQVLPRFEETYSLEESPSLLQSLGRFLHYTKGPDHNHVARVKEVPRIKRALAIGVHGYFPAPLIRSVLGQPTGTSIRFSNMAAESIRKYTADHGYSCEIEKIALEGEGRISERVDLLWKLLLNWMEEIRKADFILVACHSQGVPVSIMLVAKLISFGCVNASRVGICAMAGPGGGCGNHLELQVCISCTPLSGFAGVLALRPGSELLSSISTWTVPGLLYHLSRISPQEWILAAFYSWTFHDCIYGWAQRFLLFDLNAPLASKTAPCLHIF